MTSRFLVRSPVANGPKAAPRPATDATAPAVRSTQRPTPGPAQEAPLGLARAFQQRVDRLTYGADEDYEIWS